ncbi:MAG: 16S rRNA (cytidine1402-2'-O)-methyltransferase [Alteromonadaceae bacterium]|jgi:16S rRNA (cytidine1402-2'-O)-methyltransferase
MSETGQLFIVATPIGNLNDITYRAIETLKSVAMIAAEDTRHTGILLSHYGITTKMTAFHDHNEKDKAGLLLSWLEKGDDVALVSDAGTPLISDPGYAIVNLCREKGVRVTPIPGACAAIAAVSCSGLATDNFTFLGFIPVKQKAKQDFLHYASELKGTVICYESPRRIADSVTVICEQLGEETPVVLAKEITKTFETYFKGTAKELLDWLYAEDVHRKGEMVLMFSTKQPDTGDISTEAVALLKSLMQELPLKKAAAVVAGHYELKKNDLYKLGLTIQKE